MPSSRICLDLSPGLPAHAQHACFLFSQRERTPDPPGGMGPRFTKFSIFVVLSQDEERHLSRGESVILNSVI
uniref:Uncharacterized protein n=1 Tax=Anguilla anguilla TaxID=7936 RepID=A0A0E9W0E3_ANGAN